MRLKLCFLFAVLGLAAAFPAEEVVEDEVEIDVGDLLKELFVPALRDGRELEMTEEEAEEVADLTVDESVEREAVAEVEEQDEATVAMKAMEIARFNNYMDAIYKRMNGALKAKMMDPMELNLDQKIQQKSDKKDAAEKKPRKVTKREAEDEEEAVAEAEEEEEDDLVDMVEIDHRMGKQEKAKKAKKTKKTGDAKKVKGEKKAKLEKKKEEKAAAKKEKQQQKMKKQEEREKKRAQKKKKKEQKNRGRRSGAEDEDKKKKRKRNHNNKKNNSGQEEKKSRNKSKNNNKKKARNNNQKNEKMLGSLSGIATLKREGDVVVMDEENHKVVESTFNVGPLKLEVSKVVRIHQCLEICSCMFAFRLGRARRDPSRVLLQELTS